VFYLAIALLKSAVPLREG
jgi:hypothetical protein